ncbi:MAG: hypothetical protein CFE24_10700 [Flavobacterium sp. BFFFF2]|nr:MAG: hypothetical protein CFE24_10700 [Flavobacterium sp. BFFFF2]
MPTMKMFVLLLCIALPYCGWSQDKKEKTKALSDDAKIEWYKSFSILRDSTVVDTSLTLLDEYRHNYLRKDVFGLLPFANEGQSYTNLRGIETTYSRLPEAGYRAKHWSYLKATDIRHYKTPTPYTDLYYKSVMEQGQSLDGLIAFNTSKRLNITMAYKGLRSIGKFINQIVSNGNLRFALSYVSPKGEYDLKTHFTSQDVANGENGGITTPDNFESGEKIYEERARLEVYFKDAKSIFEGKRAFVDHTLKFIDIGSFQTVLHHQGSFETKRYEYLQPTVASTVGTTNLYRFGTSLVTSNINDQMHMNSLYNKVGVQLNQKGWGKLSAYLEHYSYNYYFSKVLETSTQRIPSSLNDKISSLLANYEIDYPRWNVRLEAAQSINKALTQLEGWFIYKLNNGQNLQLHAQGITRLPNMQAQLNQSSFLAYNWSTSLSTEKISILDAATQTKWANIQFKNMTITDYIYFSNDAAIGSNQIILSPKQYTSSPINYTSIQASKEIRLLRQLSLDQTILFQKVVQNDPILNVPTWVVRQTLCFTHAYFKKALYTQMGITANYFSSYYMNGYNQLLGDYYVQNNQKIGGFPLLDFFVNARIRQARIFIKAEHFNADFSGYNYYNAPGYPYRDFMIRFGIEWNFLE